jgi:hypothetical protein
MNRDISSRLTKVEGVASRWCQNHQDCQRPFDEIWSKWSAEWSCGCPESWPWKNSLPVPDVSEMVEDCLYWTALTYRPHSRIIREVPINTEMRLPKELRAIKKFNPFTALPEPNTFVKNRPAEICAAAASWAFGTVDGVSQRRRSTHVLMSLTSSEVCQVGKYVEERNNSQRNVGAVSNSLDWFLSHGLAICHSCDYGLHEP